MAINKRKQLLIDASFQFKIILYFSSVSLIVSSIMFYYQNLSYTNVIDQLTVNGSNIETIRILENTKIANEQSFMLFMFFVLLLFIAFGLILSNRIAGPLYRLRKHLSVCTESKNLAPVYFRKNDFFMNLQDSFNEFVASQDDSIQDKSNNSE